MLAPLIVGHVCRGIGPRVGPPSRGSTWPAIGPDPVGDDPSFDKEKPIFLFLLFHFGKNSKTFLKTLCKTLAKLFALVAISFWCVSHFGLNSIFRYLC